LEVIERSLRVYIDQNGRAPYSEWLRGLRDSRARQTIRVRLGRVRLGNLGITRSVGEGVSELIIDYGPGYRVYFGRQGGSIVILLLGGDKSTQSKDIKLVKEYWHDYQEEKKSADY
jgi:putative addiction module killer protein